MTEVCILDYEPELPFTNVRIPMAGVGDRPVLIHAYLIPSAAMAFRMLGADEENDVASDNRVAPGGTSKNGIGDNSISGSISGDNGTIFDSATTTESTALLLTILVQPPIYNAASTNDGAHCVFWYHITVQNTAGAANAPVAYEGVRYIPYTTAVRPLKWLEIRAQTFLNGAALSTVPEFAAGSRVTAVALDG